MRPKNPLGMQTDFRSHFYFFGSSQQRLLGHVKAQKKVHALVIPKGEYINLDDFSANASEKEIVSLIKGIGEVAKKLGVSEAVKGGGYRSLVNVGANGGQEVPHLHFHIFGGEKVGKMVS